MLSCEEKSFSLIIQNLNVQGLNITEGSDMLQLLLEPSQIRNDIIMACFNKLSGQAVSFDVDKITLSNELFKFALQYGLCTKNEKDVITGTSSQDKQIAFWRNLFKKLVTFEKMESHDIDAVCNKIINRRFTAEFQELLTTQVNLAEMQLLGGKEELKTPKTEVVKTEPIDWFTEAVPVVAEKAKAIVKQEQSDGMEMLRLEKVDFTECLYRVKNSLPTERPKVGFKEFDSLMSKIHDSLTKLNDVAVNVCN
ncbi:uncharacterized protein LOC134543097 [Bacillus rossius redtenbacheri]|uniref:uncharacterized protein LOC134543097 n=1 Tax=Bacillus rossius redtenbacheri TaxID=93214 RepID=UPI002FDC7E45